MGYLAKYKIQQMVDPSAENDSNYEYHSSLPDSNVYDDISSIVNWDLYGNLTGERHNVIRDEILSLYNATGSPLPDWSLLDTSEKKVVAKYFIVDKTKRDEVLTQDEQDANDHYRLYHRLSDDVVERLKNINYLTTPKSIDYKKDLNIRLHPDFVFDDRGFLTTVTYYEELYVSLNTFGFPVYNFSIPVVKYEANYSVDLSTGYVTSRIITRSWTKVSDNWGTDTKITTKIYNSKQAREEGNRRRKNLINNILIDTVGLILMTTPELTNVAATEADAMPFLQDAQSAISLYYESGAKKDANGNDCLLIQEVTNNTYSRLDNIISTSPSVTIRAYIIARLDPAY